MDLEDTTLLTFSVPGMTPYGGMKRFYMALAPRRLIKKDFQQFDVVIERLFLCLILCTYAKTLKLPGSEKVNG